MYVVAYEKSSNTETFYYTMRCLWIMFTTAVCFLFPSKSLIVSRKERFPILIARIGLIPKAMALLCHIYTRHSQLFRGWFFKASWVGYLGASKSELADVVGRGNGFFLKRTFARPDLKKNMDTFLAFLCSFDWLSGIWANGLAMVLVLSSRSVARGHVNFMWIARKASPKSQTLINTLWLQSCFIDIFLIRSGVIFIQEVSGAYCCELYSASCRLKLQIYELFNEPTVYNDPEHTIKANHNGVNGE